MSVCSKSSLNIFIPGVSSTGHSNQKCKKEAISCSKECNLEKLPPNEGWFFYCIRWIYLSFFATFYVCVVLWICQACTAAWHLFCSLPSRLQHPQPAAMFMDEMSCAAYRRDRSQPDPLSPLLNPLPRHLHRWHFSHQCESVSIWCSPLGLGRVWSCPNVMLPCGLCAGTGVSHMTCVRNAVGLSC